MARYSWLVFTNCTPGEEAEYNRWYDEIHRPDLLRVPGIVSATRSELSPFQTTFVEGKIELCGIEANGAKYRFLAVYALDTDDPNSVLNEVRTRAYTPRMEISPHMTEAYTVLFQDR
jgi:hypothetical protein